MPRTYEDLVGIPGHVKVVDEWIRTWREVFVSKTRDPISKFEKRALLFYGPPGVGKTSLAKLAASVCGWDVFELNASDTRSKIMVESRLSHVMNHLYIGSKQGRVIVMDEVDGMSSSDRGGVGALVKMIGRSREPIICVCNDMYKSGMAPLREVCSEVQFKTPRGDSVVAKLRQICVKENIHGVGEDTLQSIVKGSGNDIRNAINELQWMSKRAIYNGHKKESLLGAKDLGGRFSFFDATNRVFSKAHLRRDKEESFFSNYDMVPLMVSQCYPRAVKFGADQMKLLSEAADVVCDIDMFSKAVRQNNHWDMLPALASSCVRVGEICDGGAIGMLDKPEWFSKSARAMKNNGILHELCAHARGGGQSCIDSRGMRLDYLTTMREVLVGMVARSELKQAASFLGEYGMTRDDLFESMSELQFSNFGDAFKKIPTKAKTAFTKMCSALPNKTQHLISKEDIGRRKKRPVGFSDEEEDEGNEEEDDGVDDVDETKEQKKKPVRKKPAPKKTAAEKPAAKRTKRSKKE